MCVNCIHTHATRELNGKEHTEPLTLVPVEVSIYTLEPTFSVLFGKNANPKALPNWGECETNAVKTPYGF